MVAMWLRSPLVRWSRGRPVRGATRILRLGAGDAVPGSELRDFVNLGSGCRGFSRSVGKRLGGTLSRSAQVAASAADKKQRLSNLVLRDEDTGGRKVDEDVNPPQMRFVFLGTSSMAPTRTRNVSGMALLVGGKSWVFDCGEGTQKQIQLCKGIRAASITRIFITHLHGDHFYGLPGLLCAMCSSNTSKGGPPVEIVGPPGLRIALRIMMKTSAAGLTFQYTVHELHPKKARNALVDLNLHANEIAGKDVECDENSQWINIPFFNQNTEGGLKVHASVIKHTPNLTCVGYVVEEKTYPGKLNADSLKELINSKESRRYFKKEGVTQPLRLLGILKRGHPVKILNTTVYPKDFLGPDKKGRKIVVLGDTCDASRIANLAHNADFLVHESTNAFLPGLDVADSMHAVSAESVLQKTISHGHSTPQMAGSFAQAINARQLVLTHLSTRYQSPVEDDEELSRSSRIARGMENLARIHYKHGDITVANDFDMFNIVGSWNESEEREEITPSQAAERAQRTANFYLEAVKSVPSVQ